MTHKPSCASCRHSVWGRPQRDPDAPGRLYCAETQRPADEPCARYEYEPGTDACHESTFAPSLVAAGTTTHGRLRTPSCMTGSGLTVDRSACVVTGSGIASSTGG